jgi:hypothetical protein
VPISKIKILIAEMKGARNILKLTYEIHKKGRHDHKYQLKERAWKLKRNVVRNKKYPEHISAVLTSATVLPLVECNFFK